ncbi:DJ-1/PfpI family protein [Piscinibacter defluvii]|uniref:DJ-1/PfpI family protein n=1 Tax=Piscinibacter defluvii TaxID=1796922 RepID=UPI000FDDCDB7|nr:DJ-1/PfpI family protein [Piscinibacter defluvii]
MRSEVSVLLYSGCTFFEVALAVEVLAPRYDVRYYSPDGRDHLASNGATIVPHGSYRDLEASTSVAVLIPGGDPGSILVPENLARNCLTVTHDRSALLAGICAGNLVIAAAGLLRGGRGTHNYTSQYASAEQVETTAPYWSGMTYEHADLVHDGLIVTAMPWAYRKFASKVGQLLGALSESEASALETYVVRRTIHDA